EALLTRLVELNTRRAGEEILGSIWVAADKQPVAGDADAILRSAAAAASGHLVWLQARSMSQRRFNEGVLLQLLSGDADVDAAAGWLGVQADKPCGALIAWTPDPLNRRRLSNLLTMHFSAYRHTTTSVVSRSTIELIFCDLGDAGIRLEVARDLVTRAADSMSQPVLAAVGTIGDSLEHLSRSHRDAEAVLRVLRRRTPDGQTRIADFDEVRTAIQIDRLHHLMTEHPDLLDGHARVLLSWDERHGGNLAESVRAYLGAFGNVAEAAERTHVHPNTLRYRVRKACKIADLDLTDPEQRLITQLQLTRPSSLL
ncbi:MAG: helix-turn-helix domain-containing protein, partial [Actinomycetia bacterium]|nr:helix-turn-helix domain-containing protein [Actinomycetes bacterium]